MRTSPRGQKPLTAVARGGLRPPSKRPPRKAPAPFNRCHPVRGAGVISASLAWKFAPPRRWWHRSIRAQARRRPPRAAVRQIEMALITLSWSRLGWPRLVSRHAAPWPRKMSATSKAGRVTVTLGRANLAACYPSRPPRVGPFIRDQSTGSVPSSYGPPTLPRERVRSLARRFRGRHAACHEKRSERQSRRILDAELFVCFRLSEFLFELVDAVLERR